VASRTRRCWRDVLGAAAAGGGEAAGSDGEVGSRGASADSSGGLVGDVVTTGSIPAVCVSPCRRPIVPAMEPTAKMGPMAEVLPYRIAVLCYLFDENEQLLLLHRRKPPNRDLYSPVGGKLEIESGESPTACAVREIHEETGLLIRPDELHLTGIVSECGYDDAMHWLMFLYEVTRPVQVRRTSFEEGRLEWHPAGAIGQLPLPQTDAQAIWPMFWRYRRRFFMAHIRCGGGKLSWRLEQPGADATGWQTAADSAS
jgi:8-oxo-dGTP diphosphatase